MFLIATFFNSNSLIANFSFNITIATFQYQLLKSRSIVSVTFVHKMFRSSFLRSQNYHFFLQVTKYFFSSYLVKLIVLVLCLQSNNFLHLNVPSITFYLFLHYFLRSSSPPLSFPLSILLLMVTFFQ